MDFYYLDIAVFVVKRASRVRARGISPCDTHWVRGVTFLVSEPKVQIFVFRVPTSKVLNEVRSPILLSQNMVDVQ